MSEHMPLMQIAAGAEKAHEAQAAAGGPVMPGLAGPGAMVSTRSGRFTGVAVLLAVMAVAGGALWAMRKMATGVAIGALKLPEIDYPLEGEGAIVLNAQSEVLLADLASSTQFPQVPLDQVQKNPFEFGDDAQPAADAAAPKDSAADKRAQQVAARRTELSRDAASLKLNSIMGGRVPMAAISGAVVEPGEMIDARFRLVSIDGRRVTVEAVDDLISDFRITLSLDGD